MKKPKDTDEYISWFPESTQKLLETMRSIIQKAAPKAEEVISYNMPAFKMNTVIVYFAGYDHHIGFYPTPSGISAYEKEISGYKWSKGGVQFPLDKPLPKALITKMVKFRLAEDAKIPKKKS